MNNYFAITYSRRSGRKCVAHVFDDLVNLYVRELPWIFEKENLKNSDAECYSVNT